MPITMDMNKFQSQPMKPSLVQSRQASNAGTDPAQQEMTQQLAQLPGYQQYIDLLLNGSTMTERSRAYKALMTDAAAAGIQIPDDMKMDLYGAIRDKTWAEKHPKLSYALMIAGATAGAVGGGAAGAAMMGGAAAPAAAGGGTLASSAAGVPAMAAGPVAGGVSSGAVGAGLAGGGTAAGLGAGAAGAGAAGAGVLPSTAAGVPTAGALTAGGTSSGAVAAGLGGGGSSVLGMSPSTYELIYGAAGKGLEAYGNSKQASEQRQAELLKAQMGVAADENTRDPFRQQMAQIRNLGQMDLMQQMKAPAPIGPTGPYARPAGEGLQPQSYAPSPEMLQWIASMKQNVAGGQNTAPTMTNPANYGKTSVLNLTSPQAPQAPGATGPSGLTLEQMIALAKRQQPAQSPANRWAQIERNRQNA